MPICEADPWRYQYFADEPCPEDVQIPTEDADAWTWNPNHRWIYDKLRVAASQGMDCGPHGVPPASYPVFSKPVFNLKGMGEATTQGMLAADRRNQVSPTIRAPAPLRTGDPSRATALSPRPWTSASASRTRSAARTRSSASSAAAGCRASSSPSEHRLGRKVVVKVLPPELAAAMSAERFEREIQLAASLQQAHIVPVLAAGDMDGLPYYTMPFVEGETLRARLARRAAADRAGGRHPARRREGARVRARARRRASRHQARQRPALGAHGGRHRLRHREGDRRRRRRSRLGRRSRSSAPRSARRRTWRRSRRRATRDTDHRADIYAFGCMAYELLAGQPPFARPARRTSCSRRT